MNGPSFARTAVRTAHWKELPQALRGLWRACLEGNDGKDVARALTTNLIAVDDVVAIDSLRAATAILQRHSPCRAFLLLLDEDSRYAPAELSATTRMHGNLRDIVLEEIVLPLRRKDFDHVPGLLRPLLIDDLSIHLYWPRPWPADETLFDALENLADDVIVDSRSFGNPAHELQVLADRRRRGERITDLSWLRLKPWRCALAEAFERFSWHEGTLVTGTVRHGRTARATTLLLCEWLHDRLGAALTVEPDGADDVVGPDLVALQVGDITVEVTLRGEDLVGHVTTERHCYLPFTVPAVHSSDAELLTRAIEAG